MSELRIKGEFLHVTKFKQITEKFGVEKLYLDITDNPEYPNIAEFQIINQKLKTDFVKGVELEVYFNVQGRKWKKDDRSGFAQNLSAWKILEAPIEQQTPPENYSNDNTSDDLPF